MKSAPRLCQTLAHLHGSMKASATLQDPEIRLVFHEEETPLLAIEEGAVSLELEFPDRESLSRFQHRVATLPVDADEEVEHG